MSRTGDITENETEIYLSSYSKLDSESIHAFFKGRLETLSIEGPDKLPYLMVLILPLPFPQYKLPLFLPPTTFHVHSLLCIFSHFISSGENAENSSHIHLNPTHFSRASPLFSYEFFLIFASSDLIFLSPI